MRQTTGWSNDGLYAVCEVMRNIITQKRVKIIFLGVINMTAVAFKLAFNIMTYNDSDYIQM